MSWYTQADRFSDVELVASYRYVYHNIKGRYHPLASPSKFSVVMILFKLHTVSREWLSACMVVSF